MNDLNKTADQPEQVVSERLPYVPPAVASEEAFETLAMSCGVSLLLCQDVPEGS